jgi:tRNA pseudouridine38-40 synthase
MTHWKLTLAYDGTPFHGWQVQPGLPTVQGALSDAIHRTLGERVLPQGSGRTDTGVHALAQVASFSVNAPIPPERLHRALNRCLPNSIRILSVEAVPPDFHARHSAIRKTYEYRIFPLRPSTPAARTPSLEPDRICPPTLAPYVWPCPWPIDLEAANCAAQYVIGTHDFTTFAATDPDVTTRNSSGLQPAVNSQAVPGLTLAEGGEHTCSVSGCPSPSEERGFAPQLNPVRTITHSRWHAEDDLIHYRVTANGFLHHMVRNLVGTFVQAAAHRISPESIPTLLDSRSRSAAGPTAPASGLFLVNVEYEPSTRHLAPGT